MDASKIDMCAIAEIKHSYLSCVRETSELASGTNHYYSCNLMSVLYVLNLH